MNLLEELRRFHTRDWRADVDSLNRHLAAKPGQNAGFAPSPPSIITGNPFGLLPGNCVLVVGINPGWPSERLQLLDSSPAQASWEVGFDAYREHRANYFAEGAGKAGHTAHGDLRYNWRHFSRLGNTIAHAFGINRPDWNSGSTARLLFRERAAIFDLLPYWSTNVGRANLAIAGEQDCVRAWHRVITAFISEKRPRAIIVNNSGQRSLINTSLMCRLEAIPRTEFYGGLSSIVGEGVPVLAHPFLSHWRRSREDYVEGVARWGNHMGLELSSLLPAFD